MMVEAVVGIAQVTAGVYKPRQNPEFSCIAWWRWGCR